MLRTKQEKFDYHQGNINNLKIKIDAAMEYLEKTNTEGRTASVRRFRRKAKNTINLNIGRIAREQRYLNNL